MAAYYLKAVAPKWKLRAIYRGMADFMVLQLIGLLVVFFFPQIALWLPNKLLGP
jgi:TRAP-type mannitol/chloroaromatic compound transport system permease large subunit